VFSSRDWLGKSNAVRSKHLGDRLHGLDGSEAIPSGAFSN